MLTAIFIFQSNKKGLSPTFSYTQKKAKQNE